MNRRLFLRAGAAMGAMALLPGCTSFLAKVDQPPNLFRLTPKSTFGDDLMPVPWQLVVDQPYATASINSARIALMHNPIQIEYYARANWTDRAPDMVQGLIVESFENSGLISSVGRQSAGLRSNFVLLPELREFQAEYLNGTPPIAHIRINVKLIAMPDRVIVANESFDAEAQATADTVEDVVIAFDEALGRVLKNLVRWTLITGNQFI